MKFFKTIFITPLFLSIILSCNPSDKKTENNTKVENHESNEEEHDHEEGTETILTDEQIKTVGIQLGKIENRNLNPEITANGVLRVANKNKANATTLFGGTIQSLYIQDGDYVRKGQTLATISNPQFIQLQEEYISINDKITFAELEVQRQKDLNEGNAGALKNYQNSQSELNVLKTRRASLKQQIALMGINPNAISNTSLKSQLTITSPISGIISNVMAKIGSYVDTSTPIAEIIDNNAIHADLQVFEKDLPTIKIGQKISFTVTNIPSKIYEATVLNIGSSFEGDSKTIAVRCQILGNKNGLIDGMNITGTVNLSNVIGQAVPNDAIVMSEGKNYIFLVNEAEEKHEHTDEHKHDHKDDKTTKFSKIEVAVGARQGEYTIITPTKNITKDQHIVTKGAFFVNAKMSNSGDGHAH